MIRADLGKSLFERGESILISLQRTNLMACGEERRREVPLAGAEIEHRRRFLEARAREHLVEQLIITPVRIRERCSFEGFAVVTSVAIWSHHASSFGKGIITPWSPRRSVKTSNTR